ncbi:Acetyltransferase (GNAT) family protein [Actinopolyspora xinjiangensis]|uniref:Acetyltransferase (GNAT) family protein n=1 Tax=Actinopolyspora xinjiangensis TaxID=405564 RepID=A0A1H0VU26_9ACTN|nr:GNAT family N-acetyltransferase [Actinopolyspora xinjiangensis]SDP82082.1 Acetyltransferase (GNAT) family protein [Actinopolyspora xinjiangensis]
MTSIAEVRPIKNSDVPEILELGEELFDTSVFPYSMWSLSAIAKHLDQQPEACHVAEAGTLKVGFVLASMPFFDRKDWGYVEWIALRPDFRGRALATELGDASLRALYRAGATRVVADIDSSNRVSKLLARSMGFTELTTVTLFAGPSLDWVKSPEQGEKVLSGEA